MLCGKQSVLNLVIKWYSERVKEAVLRLRSEIPTENISFEVALTEFETALQLLENYIRWLHKLYYILLPWKFHDIFKLYI